MSEEKAFEDMESDEIFANLMDDSAEKVAHAREAAILLLEMAKNWEERASKLRHLAAVLILEAQEFAGEVGDILALEFPMGTYEPESEDPEVVDDDTNP